METKQLTLPLPAEPVRVFSDFPRVDFVPTETRPARRATGFGLHDTKRQIARRVARERAEVEQAPRRTERRPLAA